MKNHKRLIIIFSVVVLLLLILILPFYLAFGNDLFRGISEIFSNIAATQIHWWILGIIAGFVALAILVLFVIPFVIYILSKIITYLSILCICAKERHFCKIKRAPFASVCGIKEKSDFEIKTDDYKIYVHLIDVPLGFRKVITINNEKNYTISSTTNGSVKRFGGGPTGFNSGGRTTAIIGKKREISFESEKIKTIPQFTPKENEFHYIVCPDHVVSKVISGNGATEMNAEIKLGEITVCRIKTLKKRLKNQLYTPIGGIKL